MCNNHDHLYNLRHSLSHIMAQAVQRVQQADVEIAIGPAIDNGFYYDFLFSPEKQIKDEDLPKINEMMVKIVKEGQTFTRLDVSNEESEHIVKDILKQKYKAELRDEFAAAGEGISFYLNSIPIVAKENLLKGVSDDYMQYYEGVTKYFQEKHPNEFKDRFITFLDMCEGPHVESAKEIDVGAFKVVKLAGAYRRGDEKNVMMTRLYAYAFATKDELKDYLHFLEEAKKRDHRKLGKELDLFVFSDLIGPGLPIYTGRGNIIRKEIIAFSNELQSKIGYEEVHTPNMNKAELFKISGHYDKYKDDMIMAKSHYSDEEYYLKPMNCPQHTQVYASRSRSYKDLPVRIADFANLYRDERPGELNGLTRLRCFCQDDGHCFCREDQIQQEFEAVLEAIKTALMTYGMPYKVRLSLRDPKNKAKYLGSEDVREKSQKILEQILVDNQIEYFKAEGEAAFYGPKMDIMTKDSLGREWQISTIQLDFNMPMRFKLEYTDADGTAKTPVMIHRALIGSPERFMGILIEHYAGAFPLWLAPEQVRIIPVAEVFLDYAKTVENQLKAEHFRVSIDEGNDSFSKKIRNAEVQKVPYILILGEKEEKAGSVAVREFKTKEQYEMGVKAFVEKVKVIRDERRGYAAIE